MIRLTSALFLATLIALMLAGHPACEAAQSYSINVRDFGAKGDGVTDDTAAIQSAIRASESKRQQYWNDISLATFAEVVIPAGVYVISKPIVLATRYALVRGEGQVTIKQTDPTQDVLYVHQAYRIVLSGLVFQGGKRQLKFWTENCDTTMLVVEDCTFLDSNGPAIECTSMRNAANEFVDRYEIGQDGSLKYIDAKSDALNWYNSTQLHINRCSFKNCMRFLRTAVDGCFVENCHMETNPEMRGAAIVTGGDLAKNNGGSGVMKLENVECLFHLRDGKNQRLIDHLGFGLTLRNIKVKTDGPKGVCPIHNFCHFRSGGSLATYIILDDCELDAAGCPENAIVYCEEVTNLISIRNSRTPRGSVPALGFKETPDFGYFRFYPDLLAPMPASGLGYTVDANNRGIKPNLPDSMKPFARKPLPDKLNRTVLNWSRASRDGGNPPKPQIPPSQVYVSDFGAKGDNTTDDTAAIRKAFEAAGQTPGCEVVFPPGVYRISDAIGIPSDVVLSAPGKSAIWATKPGLGGFRANGARRLAIRNLNFESLGTAIKITPGKGPDPASILINNCVFNHMTECAVECIAGDMATDRSTAAHLRITDSHLYNSRQNVVSNVTCVVDNNWITTELVKSDSPPVDAASFVNYGYMRIENMLGVPLNDNPESDMRWIDNYGRLFVTSARFGGEFGGVCAVNTRRAPGIERNEVVVQDGWMYSYSNHKRMNLVCCESVPDVLVLRTNIGTEDRSCMPGNPYLMTVEVRDPGGEKAAKGRILLSGNILPDDIRYGPAPQFVAPTRIAPKEPSSPVDVSAAITIPAGPFTMGSTDGLPDEKPRRKVYLDAYRISKYEVTAGQYRKFCEATGRPAAPPPPATSPKADLDPAVNVTWDDATAYAKWAGGRLPTEAEWEKAARGTDARVYPWGNEWERGKCNEFDALYQAWAPVGSYPADVSPYGCIDMGGNVCEWCSDWYGPYTSANRNPVGPSIGKYRSVRGGGWTSSGPDTVRCAYRKFAIPEHHWYDIGFRIVMPAGD